MNRRAFVLGAVMILLGSLVAVALRSFAEATFLGAYGPRQMPWLLIATAGGFAVATLGYDALTRLAHPRAVDLGLLVGLGAMAGLAPVLLDAGVAPAILVVGLTAASQVAGLALWNRVAAAVAGRDARRMLPRAGAAVTAGGAIAGLGAGALIPRLGLASIPYVGAVVTVIVIIVCFAQERALLAGGAPGGVPGGPGMPPAPHAAVAPAVVLSAVQRNLLTAMIAVAALEAIVTTVIDLQFIANVKGRYSGETVAVALSLFYGGTNAILLVLQVAAVPRLLVTRSLPFTAAIHPMLVILSYVGFAASPGFFAIAGTRTADQVLRLATSRTSQELALSALPPGPRARWKVLLRGLVWPAGAAAAAYALLAIGPRALREPTMLAATAIGIAIAAAITARIAARRFQTALAAPLGIRQGRRDDPRRIDLETLERWTQAAGDDDPRQAALARATLARARIDATDLADHLRHDDAAVRAAMFDQLARSPAPALRGELRAAIAIEDDDHALALGIKALTIAGDDGGLARGQGAAGLSREVDDTVRSARAMLSGDDAEAELGRLIARDPAWAASLIRARRPELTDEILDRVLRAAALAPATRSNAFAVIVRAAPERTLPILADALEAGDAAAIAAIEELDAGGAAGLVASLASWSPLARATLARSLGSATDGASLIARLVDDRDPEVAYAALRTALAIARGGGELAADRIAAAHDAAFAALVAHLDTRDATAGSEAWSECACQELEIATRRCVARMLWAAAVEAAAAHRDPAPVAATARHLTGSNNADRKRALDVVQELQMRPQILGVIERWLRPPAPGHASALAAIAAVDPWLAELGAGKLASVEPALVALRRAPLFASIAGPALAALAAAAARHSITGELFHAGDLGDAMYVVASGTLVARRPPDPDRRIETGSVVGELAVLTHAARAATVAALDGAEVLAIDRATFASTARRAPELVLGLSATLAGWLAPNRPDLL